MTVREFTVMKPKTERILVKDNASDSMVFKNIPVEISDLMLFKKISSMIHVLSSSFCETGEVKIATDSTYEEIKQCMIECNLEITQNRIDLVMEQNKDGKSSVESEFILSVNERETIRKAIETKLQE
jgi:hypothetical protein